MTAEKPEGDVAARAKLLRTAAGGGDVTSARMLESQASRIAELTEALRKSADDMEKWFDDAVRPDEWKLREWINIARRALASSAEQGDVK